ncbi:type II secretion system F family protein [Neptuniibacter sp. CAU 1671]|uniref:type II secretion system F family protein n=1 Tax=Neptuniibacter sp. CAU 1671 TaxID=3032593 RepID=UPI0023DBDB41|nr:type II secretion system F family protein [Neptuniibacter sp. CAU 1671]MDF2181553.1 type II secretion system F family protein [Neptuniibacter sp. CAU 1671]
MAQAQKKMASFAWQGKDKNGNSCKGKIKAASPSEVKTQLRKQGIVPKRINRELSIPLFDKKARSIKPVDIAFFSRQMATMMKSGVPLVQALEITSDGVEKDQLKEMIMAIRNDVNGGLDLSAALAKHPLHFDDLYCTLVHAGEQSGSLEQMLDRIATYKEKVEALKAKIKKAMTYPAAVVAVGIVVAALLLIKVVPQFEVTFSAFGADLPAFTRFVINLSEYAQKWWFIGLGIVVAIIYAFNRAKRTSQKFRDSVDRFVLKIPIIGGILHNAAIARFSRTLETTFAAGVPLVDALESSAGASGNVVYREAILQIRNSVSTGQSLKDAIIVTGLFPNMASQMIAIGEEAGSLEQMLSKVADYYEGLVDDAVDNMSALIEPLIISVLGVLVGGLVIAMYLPIFQLGNVVG